jgi:predicted ATPase/DNA-binding CsgD family transcriptional regulator
VSRNSPQLLQDTLAYEQQGQAHSLRVGTEEWYSWLSTASLFTMKNSAGSFTIRKERAGSKRGGWYWKMYHRQHGKLRSAYLGKTERLTWERLTATTRRLANAEPLDHYKQEELQENTPSFHTVARGFLPSLPLTPLIGRDQEILHLEGMLCQQEKRLVTLTGTGGVGKTHLALHVARKLLPIFADGITFLSLETIRKSDDVLVTIAHALGVSAREKHSLLASVIAFLQKKHVLLVLDNFEQVVDAAPQIETLVLACPRLTVLTTSRMALHLRGEQIFPLSPLLLPDLTTPAEPEILLHSPAVCLFVQHAQTHLPSFQLTEANASSVRALCHHLDGLPLALELAAARLPLFPPEALLAHLSQRLPLLKGRQQNTPVRQQTLRNTLDWSYQLLDPHEQRLFRLLSVFVGGWTLRALEAVARVPGEEPDAVLQNLASLLDKNLIQQSEQQGPEPRFRLLETMREYASTLLAAQGESEQTLAHAVHASFYLELAEDASVRFGDTLHLLLPCLGPEHDNLLVALQWFLAHKDTNAALRLGSALEWFWAGGNAWGEGRWCLEQILAQSHREVSRERAKALAVAGKLAQMQGEYEQAAIWGHEGLTLFRQLGESQGIIMALTHLAYTEIERGAYDRAVLLGEEAYALEQHMETYTRGLHCMLIRALIFAGAYERAELLAEKVRAMSLRLKDLTGMGTVHLALGVIALMHHDLRTAQPLLQAAKDDYQEVGFVRLVLETQGILAFVDAQQGALEAAKKKYLEFAQHCFARGETGYAPLTLALTLRGLGIVAARQGSHMEAVRLWGAADRLNRNMFPFEREPYTLQMTATCTLLGEAAFARVWDQGAQMPPEALLPTQEQVAWRTEEETSRVVSPHPTLCDSVFETLTAREIDVLRLLAQGKTDRQIAEQLVISPRTVNTHVTALYRKMDVTSRSAATRYALEHNFFSEV